MSNSESKRLEAFASDEVKRRYLAAYDALLKKWPIPYEELFVPTRFGVTHVVACGAARSQPVVLLHAAVATALVWRPNVEELGRQFRIFAVDVLGQYGKSVSSRAIRSRRDFADWMSDLLDGLGITRTSLVGNSYGGFLALNQASLTPERVERVVMINPAGVFASFLPNFLKMMLAGLLSALRPATKRANRSIAAMLGRDVRFGADEQEWADLASLVWTKGMRINAVLPTVFSSAELRAIACPALLLMGENERLYDPHQVVRRARERMPTLETALIPNAHHIAPLARPAEVNERIVRFLGRQ